MTVDGKPVTKFNISLSAKKPNAKAKRTTTDSDGRFVFKSVAPGRDYELATALAVKQQGVSQRPNCKVSGAMMGFSAGQPAGFTITALISGRFRVKGGQTVTRNIESANVLWVPVPVPQHPWPALEVTVPAYACQRAEHESSEATPMQEQRSWCRRNKSHVSRADDSLPEIVRVLSKLRYSDYPASC